MLKKRFKLNFVLPGAFAFFALFIMFPLSAHSIDIGDTGWVIDGHVKNNTGFWTENWDYSLNNDPLATCRNAFRLNLNGKFTENVRLKVETLAIYEPEYPRERHGLDGGVPIEANKYNYFDFRELRLDMRVGTGHTLQFGRQIVNWGESLSARVGDVINPGDYRFDLGFTNLEDIRMPMWMIRGLHTFMTGAGTINLDWVWSPYMGPDRYRIDRRVSNAFNSYTNDQFNTPGPRFGGNYESMAHVERVTGRQAYFASPGLGFAMPAGSLPFGLPFSGAGFNNMWQNFNATSNPVDAAIFSSIFGAPAFPGAYPDGQYYMLAPIDVGSDYPDSSLEDARWGFRLGTTIKGSQIGFYFWDHNAFDGLVFKIRGFDPTRFGYLYQAVIPREKVFGFQANRNFNFGVLSMDVAYRPDRDYTTLQPFNFLKGEMGTGVVEKDFVRAQLRINKQTMIPKLNPNNAFDWSAEYVGEFILDSDLEDAAIPTYYVKYKRDVHMFMASVSTLYAFKWSVGLTALHCFNYGHNGLLQPSLGYAPDWMNNKWRFNLMYAYLYGPSFAYPYGLANQKDLVALTTTFSF